MAYRLNDRKRQIPNGLKFLQPETNWSPRRFDSFTTIVNSLISHRKSNPHLIAQKKWSVDPEEVANEVDAFNALICIRHGWKDYVMNADGGTAPPPKPQALLQQERNAIFAAAGKAKKIWSGVRTLNDWIDSGVPAVPDTLSSSRALVCKDCPKNGKGDFTSWFTKPAADVITKQIEKVKSLKLSTPYDAQINICEVCLCPLKLKVHTPIKFIKEHTSTEVMEELRAVEKCWVPRE